MGFTQHLVVLVKNFIQAFGKDFTFVRNQYHLDAFGEDQYIDLPFFNRELNCLVAVELKTGMFKTAYLGQLQGYLSVLNGFERKPHENPSIGIILCKDMNKSRPSRARELKHRGNAMSRVPFLSCPSRTWISFPHARGDSASFPTSVGCR